MPLPPPSLVWSLPVLLVASMAVAQEPPASIPGLAGSWEMVSLVVSSPVGEPVDLIAMGGAIWMTLDGDGRFVLTKQNPGDPARIAELGTWRPVSEDRIEMLGDGAAEPSVYGVAVAGDTLLMSGLIGIDLDGDGVDEPGDFEAEARREADKLAEGSGIVGAWVRSDGRFRTYRLHVPAAVAERGAAPLVLAFHGSGIRGEDMQNLSGLDPVADEAGAIVAYPDAVGGQWAIGCDCTPADVQGIRDVQFTERLIDQLAAEYPVDASRVHATGFSQGGMFASRLACELAHRVGGIATVGGGLTRVLAGRCAPSRPVPVLAFHGTSDASVPYNGDPTMLSVPATLEFWASADGCGGAVIEPVADVSDDGTVVSRTRYATCAAGSEVVLYTIERGGHTWPGSPMPFPAELGPVCHDISASQLMLEFFSRHPLVP